MVVAGDSRTWYLCSHEAIKRTSDEVKELEFLSHIEEAKLLWASTREDLAISQLQALMNDKNLHPNNYVLVAKIQTLLGKWQSYRRCTPDYFLPVCTATCLKQTLHPSLQIWYRILLQGKRSTGLKSSEF